MQLHIPSWSRHLFAEQKSRGVFALKAIRAGMTPAVALATVRLALRTNNAFICYRDVTGIASWWIHVPGNATTRIEIFIHRQNLVRFHNRSFHD